MYFRTVKIGCIGYILFIYILITILQKNLNAKNFFALVNYLYIMVVFIWLCFNNIGIMGIRIWG